MDGYYGGPNLVTGAIKLAYKKSQDFGNNNPVEINSMGPFGLRAEYFVSKRFSIGLNYNYSKVYVKGNVKVKVDNDNGGQEERVFPYKASLPRYRIMASASYHMGESEKVDPYFSVGVGYNGMKLKEEEYHVGSVTIPVPPLSARLEFGIRYFFIPNLGIHGQFGLGGGPLLAGGLSCKF